MFGYFSQSRGFLGSFSREHSTGHNFVAVGLFGCRWPVYAADEPATALTIESDKLYPRGDVNYEERRRKKEEIVGIRDYRDHYSLRALSI